MDGLPAPLIGIQSNEERSQRSVSLSLFLNWSHPPTYLFWDSLAGATAVYVPLSILLPAHVKELRLHQLLNARKQAWWLSAKPRVHAMSPKGPPPSSSSRAGEPDGPEESAPTELQEALSLAMESPLPPPMPTLFRPRSKEQASASAKTSDSHPIK